LLSNAENFTEQDEAQANAEKPFFDPHKRKVFLAESNQMRRELANHESDYTDVDCFPED
jgi:predicted phage-related endonuclease